MKTLYLTPRNRMIIDSTGKAEDIRSTSHHIDYMYVAPEDLQIVNGKEVLHAKKNDIIIQFYDFSDKMPHTVIVVKNKEWKENVITEKAEEEKRKIDEQAWALKKCCKSCCGDCDCCCGGIETQTEGC